jgi:hypothetical protein
MKMFILPDVLEMCGDKVPNVRLKATSLLLELRNCLGGDAPSSEPDEGLEKWKLTLARLCDDKDPDVSQVFFLFFLKFQFSTSKLTASQICKIRSPEEKFWLSRNSQIT